jgi:secreted PhoX family phosphatase
MRFMVLSKAVAQLSRRSINGMRASALRHWDRAIPRDGYCFAPDCSINIVTLSFIPLSFHLQWLAEGGGFMHVKHHDVDPGELDDSAPNGSTEPTIAQLMDARITRRAILQGMAAAGVYGLIGCAAPVATPVGSSLSFTESGRFLDETHHVAPGYDVSALLRWGDPLHDDAPEFRPGRQTAQAQERQFGMNNDFIAYMPLPRGSNSSIHGLLCVNHEYCIARLMWPADTASPLTREQCDAEMAAVGHSVVEIAREGKAWRMVRNSRYNRRFSARGPLMRIAGPAAGHPRMATRADVSATRVAGTQSNCAGGTTPWGTVLTAEENIQHAFTGDAGVGREAAAWRRYGINGRGLWGRHFDRFNLNREPNETNRFGWIVEIDPYDPKSMPVKRTALGRCRHECATTAVSHDGRVAVYSGDDEDMEYIYKFVTRDSFDPQKPEANPDLLDHGTLHVARFEADGKMRWLPLVFGQGPLTRANGFENQGDVLIELRRAADVVGATPMDRPEDVEANPATGRVYVALTHNQGRKPEQLNVANPRGPNKYGHIIEIIPPTVNGRIDHAATECQWEFFVAGGDPQIAGHAAHYQGAVSAQGWIAAPDNIAFDPRGRIWIATDGQEGAAGFADSLYAADTSGPRRGVTRCFFSSPRGAEVTGPAFTPDGKTLFLSIQHPGSDSGSTFDKPSTRWPDFKPDMPPRPSVVAITKADGGEIGS